MTSLSLRRGNSFIVDDFKVIFDQHETLCTMALTQHILHQAFNLTFQKCRVRFPQKMANNKTLRFPFVKSLCQHILKSLTPFPTQRLGQKPCPLLKTEHPSTLYLKYYFLSRHYPHLLLLPTPKMSDPTL